MRCQACNHEKRGWDWTPVERKNKKGVVIIENKYLELDEDEDEFIKIEGSFHRKVDNRFECIEVYLYACPKCKTVQMSS